MPQRNHESNETHETHENNEMPLLRAFRFFVVYGETVISLQPLALDKKRAALYTDKEKNGPPRAGRKRDVVWKPRTPSKPSSTK